MYKVKKENIEPLFSGIYQKWPTCDISIRHSDDNKKLETSIKIDTLVNKIFDRKWLQVGFYIDSMEGYLFRKKIIFDKTKVNRGTWRYELLGWGLIIIDIENKGGYFEMDCGVNSEKRAWLWHTPKSQLKDPRLWNWKVVKSTNRTLKRIIKKFVS